MNWLKRLMLFRLMIPVIKLKNKKADYDTDIKEIVDKIRDHDKYIATNHCNKFSGTISHEILKQAKLPTTNAINSVDQRAIKNE